MGEIMGEWSVFFSINQDDVFSGVKIMHLADFLLSSEY